MGRRGCWGHPLHFTLLARCFFTGLTAEARVANVHGGSFSAWSDFFCAPDFLRCHLFVLPPVLRSVTSDSWLITESLTIGSHSSSLPAGSAKCSPWSCIHLATMWPDDEPALSPPVCPRSIPLLL